MTGPRKPAPDAPRGATDATAPPSPTPLPTIDTTLPAHGCPGPSKVHSTIGRYRIVSLLGSGGMGEVFCAHDPHLDRAVAVKVLPGVGSAGDPRQQRFLREAQALARLEHPNVVGVYDAGFGADGCYVAMQLIDGESMDAVLARGRLPWRVAVRLMVAAGRGLAAAHAAGIVHRDVKPSNILIDRSGAARVGDFGLARSIAMAADADDADDARGGVLASELTQRGALLGTPRYMAPEQHLRQPATPASDQFAWCVTLYEALSGQHPFGDEDFLGERVLTSMRSNAVRPLPAGVKVPRRARRALLRGLRFAPDERWPSMDALLAALEPPRWRPRMAWSGAAAAVAIVALLAANRLSSPRCTVPPGVAWTPDRSRAIVRAFDASAQPFAHETGVRFVADVDDWTRRWNLVRAAACASDDDGPGAAARRACAAQARGALDALLATATWVPGRLLAQPRPIETIASPDHCDDPRLLPAYARPPARLAARVAALEARLVTVTATVAVGGPTAKVDAEALVRDADATGFSPLRARARALLATVEQRGRVPAAPWTWEAAYWLALEAGDTYGAGRFAWHRARATAWRFEHQEAERWLIRGEAHMRPHGLRRDDEVDVALLRGELALETDRHAEALAAFDGILRDHSTTSGDRRGPVLRALLGKAQAMVALGRRDEAVRVFEAARSLSEQYHGERHPLHGSTLVRLGEAYAALDGPDDRARARDAYRAAAATLVGARERAYIVWNVATLEAKLGDDDAAMASFLEAMRLSQSRDPAFLAMVLTRVAEIHLAQQRPALAAPLAGMALATLAIATSQSSDTSARAHAALDRARTALAAKRR